MVATAAAGGRVAALPVCPMVTPESTAVVETFTDATWPAEAVTVTFIASGAD